MNYIWSCTCGKDTPCTRDDQKLGATWWCDNCQTGFGCVQISSGPKVWITIDPLEIGFHNIFTEEDE